MNCLRSLKYIEKINSKYKRHGLETILIHPPEWEFEKSSSNIIDAFRKYKIRIPAIIDKKQIIIKKFKINFWPTQLLISCGEIVYKHVGEGNYRELENIIAQNLRITAKNIFNKEPKYSEFPAIYCGKRKKGKVMRLNKKLRFGILYKEGRWAQKNEYLKSLGNDAALTLLTKGAMANFVAESRNKKSIRITVILDKKFFKKIEISKPRLYNLTMQKNNKQKIMKIIMPKNLCVYSFSFQ